MKKKMSEECFDSIMAKAQESGQISKEVDNSDVKHESDKDSDYGGSDYDTGEATTFRMLVEKTQVSDAEFVECCQQVGLISTTQICSCGSTMCLYHSDIIDGVEWKCAPCGKQRALKDGTWLEEIRQIRLKDIILVLYCWARNYPEPLCQHEMDLTDVSVSIVPMIYKKCKKLCSEYFEDEVSNIGTPGEVVEIEEFQTPTGLHIVGGVERNNMKNVFFRVLPENWNRDDLCTAIADNIVSGTIIHCHNTTVLEILGSVGLRYLDKVWKLKVVGTGDCDSPLVTSLWALFERLILDKDYTQSNLVEFLFRRRMETHRDPFLFLLNVIAVLHPPSTVPTDYDLSQ
ncbi:uncharacterized protein LOC106667353 [Cimex lectularius]|uniref:Uncharacterized protein n=1 Tax=Cimex lectularius TaxID=79782 RepID=A0A8I6RV85_CIMLE|nr:uncharacterized protein LOC106667353 [Cimex lectularius]